MAFVAIGFLIITAAGLVVTRKQLAELQGALFGGRIAPGCIVAQAAIVLILAIAVYVFRRYF